MKIGIPRALLYHYYYTFWKTLFEELGCEVVLSDETNSSIVSEGSKVTVSEICVPIKIFNGHVLNLEKKNVDYILIPQFHKVKKEWYCPKFLGIPELVEYSINNLTTPIIVLDYITKTDMIDSYKVHKPLLNILDVTSMQLKKALKSAKEKQLEFRSICKKGYTVPEAYGFLFDNKPLSDKKESEITIGLMGYVYNVYDNFVSMNTIKKLEDMGAGIITFDMLDEETIKIDKKEIKQPFWTFSRKIYNASKQLINSGKIDGMIHITAFGCGPDSIIGKMMEIDCEEKNLPFMTVRVDEHSGDNHVNTRLEAFTDMIKMHKRKGGNQ